MITRVEDVKGIIGEIVDRDLVGDQRLVGMKCQLEFRNNITLVHITGSVCYSNEYQVFLCKAEMITNNCVKERLYDHNYDSVNIMDIRDDITSILTDSQYNLLRL
jgi:hypothetical protein